MAGLIEGLKTLAVCGDVATGQAQTLENREDRSDDKDDSPQTRTLHAQAKEAWVLNALVATECLAGPPRLDGDVAVLRHLGESLARRSSGGSVSRTRCFLGGRACSSRAD